MPVVALCIPRFFSILARFPFSQLWRYGATVSTRPFKGRNTGSIPVSATRFRNFRVDGTPTQKIIAADEIGAQLQGILNDKTYVMRTDRDGLCLLYWSLAADLHDGILVLLHKENPSAAFALVRPLIESFLRLHVAINGTEKQLAALQNGT